MRKNEVPIFLSYSREDDEQFVEKLYAKLVGNGYDVWWDKVSMPSRGLAFLYEIRAAIDHAEKVVVVLGPGAIQSDYVKAEWQYASSKGKTIIPILRKGGYDTLPLELKKLHILDFNSERPFRQAFSELQEAIALPLPKLGSLHGVPQLPSNFQPRPKDFSELYAILFRDILPPVSRPDAKKTTVLYGMGGVGKTVLAIAISRSVEVRKIFSDGIYWFNLAQKHSPESILSILKPSFVDTWKSFGAFDSSLSVSASIIQYYLEQALEGKKCLVILDNVNEKTQAEAFVNSIGVDSRLLITTREGGLISSIGANEFYLKELDEASALQYLANCVGKEVEDLPKQAREVAVECGYLPFALALCGALAAEGVSWADLMIKLKEVDLLYFEKELLNYPYPNLLKCLEVSLHSLDSMHPAAIDFFKKMVVFPAGVSISEKAISNFLAFSGILSREEVSKMLAAWERKSLIRLEKIAGEPRFYTLHDLQYDYLKILTPDPIAFHNELLDAYSNHGTTGWVSGLDDGYFFDYLCYHLNTARRFAELYHLLTGSPEWMRRKRALFNTNASFLKDVAIALEYFSDPITVEELPLLAKLYAVKLASHSSSLSDYMDPILAALVQCHHVKEAIAIAKSRIKIFEKISGLITIDRILFTSDEYNSIALLEMEKILDEVKGQEAYEKNTELVILYLKEQKRIESVISWLKKLENYDDGLEIEVVLMVIMYSVIHDSGYDIEAIESRIKNQEVKLSIEVARLVKAKNIKKAFELLKNIEEETIQSLTIISLVTILAEQGKIRAAGSLIKKYSSDPELKDYLRIILTGIQFESGKINRWQYLWTVRKVKDDLTRAIFLLALARNKYLKNALKIARTKENPEGKIEIFNAIFLIHSLMKPKYQWDGEALVEEARQYIQLLPGLEDRISESIRVAEPVSKLFPHLAQEIILETIKENLNIQDDKQRIKNHAELIKLYTQPEIASIEERERFLRDSISRINLQRNIVEDRNTIIRFLGVALSRCGYYSEIYNLTGLIEDEKNREEALLFLRKYNLAFELEKEIEMHYEEFPLPSPYAFDFFEKFLSCLKLADPQSALSLIQATGVNTEIGYLALFYLSSKLSATSNFEEAKRIVESMGDGDEVLLCKILSWARLGYHAFSATDPDFELAKLAIQEAKSLMLSQHFFNGLVASQVIVTMDKLGMEGIDEILDHFFEAMDLEERSAWSLFKPVKPKTKNLWMVLAAMAKIGREARALAYIRAIKMKKALEDEEALIQSVGIAKIASALYESKPGQRGFVFELFQEAMNRAGHFIPSLLTLEPKQEVITIVKVAQEIARTNNFALAFSIIPFANRSLTLQFVQIVIWSEFFEKLEKGLTLKVLNEFFDVFQWGGLDVNDLSDRVRSFFES